jgi:hypothetical protein
MGWPGVERQRAPGNPAVWGLIDQRLASVPVDPSRPLPNLELLWLFRVGGSQPGPAVRRGWRFARLEWECGQI